MATQIALYYPNIVGYARFGALVYGFAYFNDSEMWPWALYGIIISQALDGIDGMLARKFD